MHLSFLRRGMCGGGRCLGDADDGEPHHQQATVGSQQLERTEVPVSTQKAETVRQRIGALSVLRYEAAVAAIVAPYVIIRTSVAGAAVGCRRFRCASGWLLRLAAL